MTSDGPEAGERQLNAKLATPPPRILTEVQRPADAGVNYGSRSYDLQVVPSGGRFLKTIYPLPRLSSWLI